MTEAGPVPRSSSRRVLVVDDYPDSADMLAEALEVFGHQVAVAHDAAAALALADTFSPDVALLDLRLPQMDGFELAERLKASRGVDLVLVAITGLSGARERARASEAGFHHYLLKPFDMSELEALLTSLPVAR